MGSTYEATQDKIKSEFTGNIIFSGNLKCLYTNADSLVNKMDELKLYAECNKPHIIIINEVVPKHYKFELTENDIGIDGYDIWHNMNELNQHSRDPTGAEGKWRGVAIYTAKLLNTSPIGVSEVCEGNQYLDAVIVSIQLNKMDNAMVCGFYRSPSSTTEQNRMLFQLIERIVEVKPEPSHILICGDFNFKEIDWTNWMVSRPNISSGNTDNTGTQAGPPNKQSEEFLETCQNAFLYQHVMKPTRRRGNDTPSLIDLVFSNEEHMVINVEHLSPLGASDHSVLRFDMQCQNKISKKIKTRYLYEKGDYDKLRNMLDVDWKNLFKASNCENDANIQYKVFLEKFNIALNACIPKKEIILDKPHGRTTGKTIMDHTALKAIRKKHSAWKRYMETKEANKYLEYCKIRNKVRQITRQIRKQFESRIAQKVRTNPKAFWAYVKSKTKAKPGIPDLTSTRGQRTQNDQEKAEVLSEFFKSVFTVEGEDELPDCETKELNSGPLKNIVITFEQIMNKIKGLNVSKSPGPDNISPVIMKKIPEAFAKPLLIIYHTSLMTQSVPLIWKSANITAIFKKGDRQEPSNYRPVSLTCIPCKIMESIIRESILEHMYNNKLLTSKQYGFVTKKSTSLQLLKVLDEWTGILDHGSTGIDCIYCDFLKAFDTVPHKRLILKISSYGITGNVLGWLSNFLQNRTQRVCVNGMWSRKVKVLSGVPQGSVLGPLLFVIYINDLPDVIKSQIYLFADDTKIFRRIDSGVDSAILQNDLISMCNWSNKWKLKFHPKKCKVMCFGKYQGSNQTYYMVNQAGEREHLETADNQCEKDLGVIFDSKLSFDQHIASCVAKANKVLGLIKRTFQFIDEELLRQLYTTLVRPHLEYAQTVWSPHLKKHINVLEGVQRRATRILPSLKELDYKQRLTKLNLYSLTYRRIRGDMIELFKIVTGLYDPDASPHVTRSSTTTRGNDFKLHLSAANTKIRQKYFTNRSVQIWNSLPNCVVNATSVDIFKKRIDNCWATDELKFDYQYDPKELCYSKINSSNIYRYVL